MINQASNTDKMKQTLENGIKNYKLFIDTCSLLFESADAFWSNVTPILSKTKSTVIIPLRVYEEVNKFTVLRACPVSNPGACPMRQYTGYTRDRLLTDI